MGTDVDKVKAYCTSYYHKKEVMKNLDKVLDSLAAYAKQNVTSAPVRIGQAQTGIHLDAAELTLLVSSKKTEVSLQIHNMEEDFKIFKRLLDKMGDV